MIWLSQSLLLDTFLCYSVTYFRVFSVGKEPGHCCYCVEMECAARRSRHCPGLTLPPPPSHTLAEFPLYLVLLFSFWSSVSNLMGRNDILSITLQQRFRITDETEVEQREMWTSGLFVQYSFRPGGRVTSNFFLANSLSYGYRVPKQCVLDFHSDMFSQLIQLLTNSLLTQRSLRDLTDLIFISGCFPVELIHLYWCNEV